MLWTCWGCQAYSSRESSHKCYVKPRVLSAPPHFPRYRTRAVLDTTRVIVSIHTHRDLCVVIPIKVCSTYANNSTLPNTGMVAATHTKQDACYTTSTDQYTSQRTMQIPTSPDVHHPTWCILLGKVNVIGCCKFWKRSGFWQTAWLACNRKCIRENTFFKHQTHTRVHMIVKLRAKRNQSIEHHVLKKIFEMQALSHFLSKFFVADHQSLVKRGHLSLSSRNTSALEA
jgi:hypothetical protein